MDAKQGRDMFVCGMGGLLSQKAEEKIRKWCWSGGS
jgi:hypothetical protein